MNLKKAIGFSIALHLILLGIRASHGITLSAGENGRPLHVTYGVQKIPQIQPALVKREAAPSRQEKKTQPIENSARHDDQPVSRREELPASPAPVQKTAPVMEQKSVPAPVPHVQLSEGVAVNLPDGEFEMVLHRQDVRRHLKSHLNYPANQTDGSVRISLLLDADGQLKEASILEASDGRLAESALEGIHSAQPYPPFPKQMKSAQVRYEFLVQYRPE